MSNDFSQHRVANRTPFRGVHSDSDRFITIASRARTQAMDPITNPTARFVTRLITKLEPHRKLDLLQVCCPHAFPTSTGTFVVNYSATDYTINVEGSSPSTSYQPTATELASDLQSELISTIGAGWTVTYTQRRNRFVIDGPGAFTMTFTNATKADLGGPGWLRIAAALGFNEDTTYSSTADSISSAKNADLRGPEHVFIVLNRVRHGENAGTSASSTYTFEIPITTLTGYVNTYRKHRDYEQYQVQPNQSSRTTDTHLTVQLVYGNNQPAELYGTEWSFIISVHY